MKTLFAILLFALPVSAADVLLAFNPSTSTNVTYFVYGKLFSTGPLTYSNRLTSFIKVPIGTNLSVIISGVSTSAVQFAVTAQRDTLESEFSNSLVLSVPLPVSGLKVGP